MPVANRIASALLGLVLLAGGLLIVVQTITAAFDRPWPIPEDWRDTLASTPWSDRAVLLTAVIVGLVGLVALIAQLVPRRQRRLPAETKGNIWWVSRRSVERRVARAAAFGGGARNPKAVVRGDSRQWRLRLSGDAPPHRHEAVERAARHELSAAGAPANVEVRMSLRQPKRVA